MNTSIVVPQAQLDKVVREYQLTYLAVFGSQARNQAKPLSDLDLLVNYKKPLGLIRFSRLRRELSDIFQKDVDLVSEDGLSKHIRPYIQQDLHILYETT